MRKPFSDLVSATSAKAQLHWTPDLIEQYDLLKKSILDCPLLYHQDPTCELHVETDASNIGIGAFIYQMRGEIKEPLHFVSLSFTDVQQRWKIVEQEAFAPFFAITSVDYLFRCATFTYTPTIGTYSSWPVLHHQKSHAGT
jgi:hypothetical protein